MPAFSNKLGLTRGGLRLWAPGDVTTGTFYTPLPYQWYDASSSTTVTLSGSTVTGWNDRGTGAKNLTGVYANATLTRNAASLNSLDTITIVQGASVGQNAYFINTSIGGLDANNLTAFTVNKNNPTGGRQLYGRVVTYLGTVPTRAANDYGTTSSIVMQLYGTTAGRTSLYYNSVDRVAGIVATNGTTWNLVMSQRRSGTNASIQVNGSTVTNATGLPLSPPNSLGEFSIGQDFARADSGMNGGIAEVLIYNSALDQNSIDRVTGYLAWKWGLQGNLPATHPYKNGAPYNETPIDRTVNITSTASTNVFLLRANSGNTFTDMGGNALAITKVGTVNYSTSIPFGSSALNSANFGTGSGYLNPAANSIFAFGTGNWTVECFMYLTARPTSSGLTPIFDSETGGSGARPNSLIIYLTATGVCEAYQDGAARVTSGSNTVALNSWTHIAVARNGSTTTIYFNGASVGSSSYSWASMNLQGGYLGIVTNVGNASSQYGITGLLSNVRVTKGTAVYTANFTTPTSDLSVG